MLLLAAATLSMPLRAAPTTYRINFTTQSGTAPTSGSFTYDPSTGFSNFIVVWNGQTYNLTSAANSPTSPTPTGCPNEAPTSAYGFIIMSQTPTCPGGRYNWLGIPSSPSSFGFVVDLGSGDDDIVSSGPGSSGATSFGGWSITPETPPATPAPASLILALIGLASIAVFYAVRSLVRKAA